MKLHHKLSVLVLASLCGLAAQATPITNLADYNALSAGSVVDFNSTATGFYGTLTVGNLTMTAASFTQHGQTQGIQIFLDNNQHLGVSSSTPPADNAAQNSDSIGLTFSFATAVSGFAFQFGNSAKTHTISAYNGNTLLESYTFGDPQGNPAAVGGFLDGYAGLVDANITRVELDGIVSGVINFDDIKLGGAGAPPPPPPAGVPEPGSLALAGLAMVGLAASRRRSRVTAA
jgi:hypothetical protein